MLAAANLPPTFHPFAIQSARWVHNRLPMASRGNQSPLTMLSRATADLSYLRAFGSLCHYTVPVARRIGDRHLADRGSVGLYLGPSEESPASVVYAASTRTVVVTRDIICYEDRFPGVLGVPQYTWFPALGEEGGVQASLQQHSTPHSSPTARPYSDSQSIVELLVDSSPRSPNIPAPPSSPSALRVPPSAVPYQMSSPSTLARPSPISGHPTTLPTTQARPRRRPHPYPGAQLAESSRTFAPFIQVALRYALYANALSNLVTFGAARRCTSPIGSIGGPSKMAATPSYR